MSRQLLLRDTVHKIGSLAQKTVHPARCIEQVQRDCVAHDFGHEPHHRTLKQVFRRAMPLQKLEQLRNQDSPAKLFKLMQGDPGRTPDKKGKNW